MTIPFEHYYSEVCAVSHTASHNQDFRTPTSAFHGLLETMHTALGTPSLPGKVSNARYNLRQFETVDEFSRALT
jgi:hypothetical protein